MQIPEATSKSRFGLRRNASQVATALLCLLPLCLPCSLTHAAEARKQTARATVRAAANPPPTVKTIQWPDISWGVKDSITWLSNITVNGLLPRHTIGTAQLGWDDDAALQFDVERQLFKSIRQATYGDSLKKTLNQQNGVQVGSNTQFHWGVQRYWTVDDRQEVAVKLGLHFDFR